MNKLIFDPVVGGHHIEFLWNLIKIQEKKNELEKTFFVVGKGFVEKAIKDYGDFELEGNNFSVIEINNKEFNLIKNKNIHVRHCFHFLIMAKYARKFNASKVIVMDLNQMLKIFFLSIRFLSFEITGILFNGNKFYNLQGIKEKLFYNLFNNLKFRRIFILNGEEVANKLNDKFKTRIFGSIPDPLPQFNLDGIKLEPVEKIVLLYIGSITKRKGIDIVLDSFKEISNETSKLYQLRIFGKVEDSIKSYVNTSVEYIKKLNDLDIIYEPHFISHSTFIKEVVNSDYVLALYKEAEISSGILGYSILLNKDLIGSNSGFIGSKYLREWKGQCITPKKEELIKILNKPLEKRFRKPELNTNYMSKHSYENFYKILDE